MEKITIATNTRTALLDITGQINDLLAKHKFHKGICYLFVPHTTAAITINEHADPDVKADILAELNKLIPYDDNYRHSEGNSAAHIKASLIGPALPIAVENNHLQLGTWQGVFFCEFDGPRARQLWVSLIPA
jgi:secondary thiamine-phosphate synthase enzyme